MGDVKSLEGDLKKIFEDKLESLINQLHDICVDNDLGIFMSIEKAIDDKRAQGVTVYLQQEGCFTIEKHIFIDKVSIENLMGAVEERLDNVKRGKGHDCRN
jgi:hypothetical protein